MSAKLQNISAKEAWEICQINSRALLIDVRSSMEYLFVGHPKGAIHIPWIDEPDWEVNSAFVTEIRKLALGGLHEGIDDVPIILICRSGNRSTDAGQALIDAGLVNVSHIEEGFEGELDENHHRSTLGGWRYHDFPWEQC